LSDGIVYPLGSDSLFGALLPGLQAKPLVSAGQGAQWRAQHRQTREDFAARLYNAGGRF